MGSEERHVATWPSALTIRQVISPSGLVDTLSAALLIYPVGGFWARSRWSKFPEVEPLPNPWEEGAGQGS